MHRRAHVALFLLTTLCACGGSVPREEIRASGGAVDLSAHDFRQTPLVVLGGEWHYFPGKLFRSAADAALTTPLPVVVPQTWAGEGHATYRLKIRLPVSPEPFAIHMEAQLSAYDVFVDGYLRAASGKPAPSAVETVPATEPLTLVLPQGQDHEIFLRVANYHHRKGGLFKKVLIGNVEGISREINTKRLIDTLLVGILAVMAVYHAVIFLLRRRNRAALYFGMVCLMILLRTVTTGEKIILLIWPHVPFAVYTMLEYLSYFWSIPFALHFFFELFPGGFTRWAYRIFYWLAAAFSLVVLVTPLKVYSHTSYLYMPVMAIGVIAVLYILARVTWRRAPNALMLATGFILLLLAVVNDSLNTLEILRTGYLVHFGFLAVVISYSSVLAARFSRALDESEDAARMLAHANDTLENRVTERTAELLSAKNAAENANRLKDNFLALVSHDLRSPLSGIYSALQTVRLAPLEADKRNNLVAVAEKSAGNLLKMIDGLLQLHRFKRGHLNDTALAVFPALLTTEILQTLGSTVKDKQLVMRNEVPADWQLKTNPHLLRHVLRNLLTNAVKFSHPGGQIVIARAASDSPAVSVSDSGVGMNAAQVAAIIGNEQAMTTTGTAGEQGSGLGLAICREMLASEGGELSVDSEPGKGSTFTLRIPIAQ